MIKIATIEDFDLVFKFSKNFSKTVKQSHLFDEDRLKSIIETILKAPNEEQIILLHGEAGMLVACIQPFLFGTAPIAIEIAWWVEPEYRKQNVGKELIQAYEFWANKLNCEYMILSCYADNDVSKFYEGLGYTLHEKAYIKGR